ncbi:hypothetical protein [Acinetobacter johnsonii]|uniref:hypothetical protein n=1 Tax=Acinetobacter johnsonii TaxID=40214 RepID=UPI0032B5BE61
MKNRKFLFHRISNQAIFFAIVSIIFLKIIYFYLVNFDFLQVGFGAGSDANYYHSYAIGELDFATTIWPEILRFFNDLSLYNRDFFSFLLFFISLLIIPYLTIKLTGLNIIKEQKNWLLLFFIIGVYPTLLFYSTDIFRDTFMILIYLVILSLVKNIFFSKSLLNKFIFFIFLFPCIYLLYSLREYLGLSILLSLFLFRINFNKKKLFIYTILYLLVLFLLNYMGFFSSLTEYREGFEEVGGGSTIGLNFSNPILFIPNLILSFLAQMFGLYITNPLSLLIFFIETLPFLLCFFYIFRNIKYQDNFIKFLLLFFLIYASVWVIGNDNVGTAVRLRMFNYFAIYICAFYIMHKKHNIMLRDSS